MKSTDEIKSMLVTELIEHLPKIDSSAKTSQDYYNELLGDTSFLLVGLLEAILEKQYKDWPSQRWMDDCLITNFELKEKRISIWGLVIWGVEDITEEWVEPMYFEMELDEKKENFGNYKFWFSDRDQEAISYTFFRKNRSYWPAIDRNWLYMFDDGIVPDGVVL